MEDLVVPGGFVVGMEEEVGVAFDHAGEQGFAGQVDYCRVSRCWDGGADCFDFVAADQDGPTFVGLGIDAIEDPGGFQKIGGGIRHGRQSRSTVARPTEQQSIESFMGFLVNSGSRCDL